MNKQYPIGKFQINGDITDSVIEDWVKEIEELPALLCEAVSKLNNEQLDTPYREGGWTIRQVVHHIADSHMNSYIRIKLALTEDNPSIKLYDEARWAELSDYSLPIEESLNLINGLHGRWVYLLRSLDSNDLAKTFHHPELGKLSIAINIGIYAWHGKHHLAHITNLCKEKNWK